MNTGAFDLQRFVDAQAPTFEHVVRELENGRKRTHWMWFVFPQLAGLGTSAMSARYAIRSMDEARAYLDHPILGPRLRQCVRLLLQLEARTTHEIFGSPDDRKLQSCITLFARASAENEEFVAALERYYGGQPDEQTVALLS